MHPLLLYLENAIKGAFIGGAWGIMGIAIVSLWTMPGPLDLNTKQSVLLAEIYTIGAFSGIVAGLVTSLLLTRRALRRAKQTALPPVVHDENVWPPPPRDTGMGD